MRSIEVFVDELEVQAFLHEEAEPAIAGILGPHMVTSARSRAPVMSGRLLDSIGWTLAEDGSLQVYAVFYDMFLELPARQIAQPRPTLTGALDDVPRLL